MVGHPFDDGPLDKNYLRGQLLTLMERFSEQALNDMLRLEIVATIQDMLASSPRILFTLASITILADDRLRDRYTSADTAVRVG